jgi:nitronate monooxygenase
VALQTVFTALLSVEHPIALAPMGDAAGGALAAAVSNGGGLGLLGGGRGDREWLERELTIVHQRTNRPWGVGFQSWSVERSVVQRALDDLPSAVMLSFGDPTPFADMVHRAGSLLIIQVTDLDEARQARHNGADLIVAQGTEAGGHGGGRATLPFVPAVVDLVAPIPVLAAGGIADGRGLAAALVLGAAGALVGTRFLASPEALLAEAERQAIVAAAGDATERNRILDIARDSPWPERYTARTLRNAFLDQWRGREDDLRADPEALAAYRQAAARRDLGVVPIWAGEAVDLITEATPAGDIVVALAAEAELALAGVGRT